MFYKCRAFKRYKLQGCAMCQTVFMHTNVSTCDFLRFDANDKGDFEAQKLEKKLIFHDFFNFREL